MKATATVTLSEAALQLGRSYQSTLRLVLTRQLDGHKHDGHWVVDAASLRAFRRRQPAGPEPGEIK